MTFEELLTHIQSFTVLEWVEKDKYTEAKDADFIVKWLIENRDYHRESVSDAKIKAMFKKDLGSRGNQVVLGKAKAQDELQRKLNPSIEFILLVNFTFWNDLTPEMKVILIDHELLHMRKQHTDKGLKIGCVPHDFEEFAIILKVYGDKKVLDFHHLSALMFEQKKDEEETEGKSEKVSEEGLNLLDEN